MKLDEDLKNKINEYFDNISDKDLYDKLVNEYNAVVEDINEKKQ